MESARYLQNSKNYYISGLLFILVGFILTNVHFSLLDYPVIGIGVILMILGLNETIKCI